MDSSQDRSTVVLNCGKCSKTLQYSGEETRPPKYLSCLHILCHTCMESIVASNKEPTASSECPVCCTPFKTSADVFFLENFTVSQKVVDFMNGKEVEIECQNCTDGKATAYCRTCDYPQLYCDDCIAVHDRLRSNKFHVWRTLDDMKTKGAYPETNRRDTPKCDAHADELSLYCRLCQKSACTRCAALEHSAHEQFVTEINAASKNIRKDVVNKLSNLTSKIDVLKVRETHIKSENTRLLGSYIETAENMTRFFDEVRRCIGEREATLHKQLMDAVDNKIKALDIDCDATKTEISSITQQAEFLNCVYKYGGDYDIVTSLQDIGDMCEPKPANEEPIDNGSIHFKVGNLTSLQYDRPTDEIDVYIGQIPNVFSTLGVIKRTTTVASRSHATMSASGKEVEITIQAIGKNKQNITTGGDLFIAEIEEPNGSTVKPNIIDSDSGIYIFRYRCICQGKYKLNISLFGCQIRGSPIYFFFNNHGVSVYGGDDDADDVDSANPYTEIIGECSLYGNIEMAADSANKGVGIKTKKDTPPILPPRPGKAVYEASLVRQKGLKTKNKKGEFRFYKDAKNN